MAHTRGRAAVAVAALVVITSLWGLTFVIVQRAVATLPPVPFLAARHWIAAATLALAWMTARGRAGVVESRRALLFGGAMAGLALAAGYLFQTLGLTLTSAADAGLITGLFAVLTPLGVWAVHRQRPPAVTLGAAAACLLGTALLTGAVRPAARVGDLLVLGCAISFAIHILLLARFAPVVPALPLATVQLTVAAMAFTVLTPLSPSGLAAVRAVVPALLLTGVGASALAFAVQTWAQRLLSPSRTALVLATEPVFAVLFAFLLAGDRYGAVQWAGAVLVLGAIAGHEWWLKLQNP